MNSRYTSHFNALRFLRQIFVCLFMLYKMAESEIFITARRAFAEGYDIITKWDQWIKLTDYQLRTMSHQFFFFEKLSVYERF